MSRVTTHKRLGDLEKQQHAGVYFLNLPVATQKLIIQLIKTCKGVGIDPADLFQAMLNQIDAELEGRGQ